MKFENMPRVDQYKTVFNAVQKKKILNRRLMTTLKELRELTEHSAEFTKFKDKGHTKLDPLVVKSEISAYYERLKLVLSQLDDPQINLWIENNGSHTA